MLLSQCPTNCLVSILVCVFVVFQKFEPFRGDKNLPASLEPSSSEAEEMPTTLRFGTLPLKTSQLPFIFPISLFPCFKFVLQFPSCFCFCSHLTPFPNGLVTKVTHLNWIRRFPFLFPLLFKVLTRRFVPLKPSCRWWRKTQMTTPDPLLTSTTSPPIRETRGPSPTTSSSADSGDDLSKNWPSVAEPNGLWDVRR